ncbi:hypothetical protein V3I05_05370 [Helicobacter mastomyrinus]|uniref:Uncharacterized protein n=1 Tax=Helicobacter mastomyrinus TaxID=287948 RepID=A0ABZ3F4K6_9HELI
MNRSNIAKISSVCANTGFACGRSMLYTIIFCIGRIYARNVIFKDYFMM